VVDPWVLQIRNPGKKKNNAEKPTKNSQKGMSKQRRNEGENIGVLIKKTRGRLRGGDCAPVGGSQAELSGQEWGK